jgi:hypothetical protein
VTAPTKSKNKNAADPGATTARGAAGAAKRQRTASATRKATPPKSPTTARGKESAAPPAPVDTADSASPFITSGDPKVRYCLTPICDTAQGIEDGTVTATDRSAEAWHMLCPVATYHAGYLTICNHEWHHANPRCWICKGRHVEGTSTQLDPERRCCLDAEACALRAKTRTESDPRFERYQQYREQAAKVERADERRAEPRAPRVERPTEGTCDHCGAPTKGGHFVAGHDAKLKSELAALAREGDVEALAELMLRPTGWLKIDRIKPSAAQMKAADQIVQTVPTETFLVSRSLLRAKRHVTAGLD